MGYFWIAALIKALRFFLKLLDREPMEFVRDGREFWVAMRAEAPVVWFDDSTRIALERVGEEAEILRHEHLSTGHLVLGLLRESRGRAGQFLRDIGIKAAEVRQILSEALPAQSSNLLPELSEVSKEVLRLALELRQRIDAEKIATEHLLFSLLEHGEGSGLEALVELGFTAEELRSEARNLLLDPEGLTETDAPHKYCRVLIELSSLLSAHIDFISRSVR